jgi:hypothetical protein
MDEDVIISDGDRACNSKPAVYPPSSLHTLLNKVLVDSATRNASRAVLIDPTFVEVILNLSAANENTVRRLEETIVQLNRTIKQLNDKIDAKFDPVMSCLADLEKRMSNGPNSQQTQKKSFASTVANSAPAPLKPPSSRPPPNQVLASLKPKRVIIHSNPLNTTLKDVPKSALVQKANEALSKLNATVDGELVAIRGASMLPSGDVSFYIKNRNQQKWLMEHKHIWSKEVHADLESTPSTFSVMAHGVPRSFDIGRPSNLALLASENNFQASALARVRWMGSNEGATKKAGSIVLSFTNKDLALRVEKSGIFLNYDFHRTDRFKPRPPQCFKCLRMGHFGKWCREMARCAKCAGKHPTNECPEGIGNVKSCVLCKEGLKNKIEGITDVAHTPFDKLCPYKKAWLEKRPLPSQ